MHIIEPLKVVVVILSELVSELHRVIISQNNTWKRTWYIVLNRRKKIIHYYDIIIIRKLNIDGFITN